MHLSRQASERQARHILVAAGELQPGGAAVGAQGASGHSAAHEVRRTAPGAYRNYEGLFVLFCLEAMVFVSLLEIEEEKRGFRDCSMRNNRTGIQNKQNCANEIASKYKRYAKGNA